MAVCKRKHPLTADNVYVNPNGSHQCRTCLRLQKAKYRSAHRKELAAKQRTRYYGAVSCPPQS